MILWSTVEEKIHIYLIMFISVKMSTYNSILQHNLLSYERDQYSLYIPILSVSRQVYCLPFGDYALYGQIHQGKNSFRFNKRFQCQKNLMGYLQATPNWLRRGKNLLLYPQQHLCKYFRYSLSHERVKSYIFDICKEFITPSNSKNIDKEIIYIL